MPVRTTFPERLLLLRLNRGPGPSLDLFATGAFEALLAADDLGVLDALAGEPRTTATLAEDLDADPAALEALLSFLEATGYVEADGARWAATSMTRRWLSPAEGTDMRPWLRFWRDVAFPFWREHVGTTLREGRPPLTVYEYCDAEPGRWELVQRAFRSAASLVLDDVVDRVPVPAGAERLLDVGGGHGLYAVELCRRHGLSATVVDAPEALGVAEEEVAAAGLADRIELRGADYLADDLGSGYDLALLFNVIHAHDAATVRTLLERVREALAPGGRVVVFDQLSGTARLPVARTGVRFAALTYVVTLGGQVHDADDLADWLRAAGFEGVERRSLWRVPGNALVSAERA